ncbi:MAG: hypothetical protein KGI98_01260 [Euryarchaeota archaeon]|nr:hypothetical protein [Euryarchaeota archaeon]MDE1879324.1 hypothetical protein [Euryarchaeota archaeon]
MPLLFPDTAVSHDTMVQLYQEFVKELEGEQKILLAPPVEVYDPLRLQTARELLDDALHAVRHADPAKMSREELRAWVNLQYDLSKVAVEYLKTCLAMPSVPKKRS